MSSDRVSRKEKVLNFGSEKLQKWLEVILMSIAINSDR